MRNWFSLDDVEKFEINLLFSIMSSQKNYILFLNFEMKNGLMYFVSNEGSGLVCLLIVLKEILDDSLLSAIFLFLMMLQYRKNTYVLDTITYTF